MKNKYIYYIAVFLLFSFSGIKFANAQITIASDTPSCGSGCTLLTATMIGQSPTSAGITTDDGWSGVISIGFTYNFYGNNYTQLLIGSNGALGFNTSLAGSGFGWSITSALLGNASVKNCICGPWCDIYIPAGGTITYATVGTAPNRKFVATWCRTRMYSCTSQWTTTQIIIYETSNIAEAHIAHKTICTWNGGYAIVGVQNNWTTAAGAAATAAPGRDYPSVYTCTNEAWQFTPFTTSTGTIAYSVAAISFAPVPYSSSSITWADSTSGSYLGSGDTLRVCPTVTTTYLAYATGCADTSFAYITVTPVPTGTPVNINPVDTARDIIHPSICGVCDASIKLNGINPYIVDSIFYSYNGVPQPVLIDSAGSDSSLTLRGLCAGVYDYIYVKQGDCISNSVGPLVIRDPAFTALVRFSNPTSCGACDGSITVYGLVPGFSDTINYMKGGVPQPPLIGVVGSSGAMLISGLTAGVYTNITAKMNYCVTPPLSATLVDPYFGVSDTSHTNTSCSMCDGTITLYGLPPGRGITVNYTFNGVAQAPVVTTSTGAGTVTITGLCPTSISAPGIYDNITATLTSCVPDACVSAPVGPILVYPPPLIPIRVTGIGNPTECGACNGTIKITGMAPGTIDTIFYNKNGVVQTPVIYAAGPDSSVTIYNLCEGTYSDFFIKVGPCPTTTIVTGTVLVDPPIVPLFSTDVRFGCTMDTVYFTNKSTSPGLLYYVWNFGDGRTDTTASPKHLYKQGVYIVKLYVTNRYCVDSFDATLNLVHPIKAAFAPSTDVICQGVPVTFTNASTGVPPTYVWSFGDGFKDTATNPNHSFRNIGKYDVRLIATNFVPCSDTIYKTITVDTQSLVSMQISDTTLCRGSYITLDFTHSKMGNTGISWNMGNGDSIFNASPVVYAYQVPGVYNITANATYRVCNPVSVTRTVRVYPTPQINLGPDTAICEGGAPIILTDIFNVGNPSAKWLWSTGETTSSIAVSKKGVYFAAVSLDNCTSTDSVVVGDGCYINVPNIFSPNADGINDYFYPRNQLSNGLVAFKLSIFNRWGQSVFETNALEGRGWDGKFNGVPQPQGVYIYLIEATFKDGKRENHNGNITLVR